jgi:hypothetical protein
MTSWLRWRLEGHSELFDPHRDKFDQVCSGCGASWAGFSWDSNEDPPCTCDLSPSVFPNKHARTED